MTAVIGVASDAELVTLAKAGDREAFRELFDRHADGVAAACRQKVRSRIDVDDAVQEGFARALANLDQLRNAAQFGAWVRSIAIRACMDQHRAARRVIVVDDETHAELADGAPLPDEQLEQAERAAVLWASLDKLGERDRQALYLRHIVEAPVAAVADELGLTEGSTRVMLTRARERLRLAASGLGSLVPLSWRQWIRDHLHGAAPSLEALAAVVAVGVASVMIPAADAATPDAPAVAVRGADDDARASKSRPATRRESRASGRSGVHKPAAGRDARQRQTEPPTSVAVTQRRGLPLRLRDRVEVKRDYPDESESQELFDVTVFSGDKDSGELANVRLYGDEISEGGQAAAEVVTGLSEGDQD